jgi:large subunit ribosomal protein L1
MGFKSKRIRETEQLVGERRPFLFDEAVDILKKSPSVKFDQTVDISIKLGIDPKKSDQQVRGTVSLPNGTGKSLSVLVFASGSKVQEALDAGAEFAGGEELLAKVRAGWTDFDAVITTPDMMREVGKLGKVLGPRGLMPTPKAGTVTNDIATAVREVKAGKIEFKLDRHGVCNVGVGKLSFAKDAVIENIRALLQAIYRAKPSTAKGQYFVSVTLSSTMGPGLKIDSRELPTS